MVLSGIADDAKGCAGAVFGRSGECEPGADDERHDDRGEQS
jgi:hypothetical protein